VFTGVEDKLISMSKFVRSLSLTLKDVCHVGDDLQDMSLLEACGTSVCPQDAVWQVKEIVDLVLTTPGGRGCVRELTEKLALI
jgi:YrbI family 3-deoxy-D-manno-octulosonate 8-phosphate phosphatase